MKKFALCVGGTSGIGRAVALNLAKNNVNVVVVGRNEESGNSVLEGLKLANPKGEHSFLQCDAFLMKNIRKVCGTLNDKLPMINYCIFTQGMVSMQKRNETIEGIDKKMALHYYGRVQFIECLLPLLRNGITIAKDSKVISVLSAAEHQPYLNRTDLMLRNNYTLSDVANATGFYTDLIFDHYSRLKPDNDGIAWMHMHPGNVKTNWGKDLQFIHRVLSKLIQAGGTSPEKCADNLCKSIFSEYITNKGGFYIINKIGELGSTTSAHGPAWREEVYKHTMDMLESTINNNIPVTTTSTNNTTTTTSTA